MRQIGFISREYKDFTYYLALLLNNLEYRVLIWDISPEQDFKAMLSVEMKEQDFVTFRNIDFSFQHYQDDIQNLEQYQYVLKYLGEFCQEQALAECDFFVLNSSMMKHEIDEYFRWIHLFQKNGILVLRDLSDKEVRESFVKNRYGQAITSFDKVYKIPLDYIDKEYQTELDYQGVTKLQHISSRFEKVLEDLAGRMTGREAKDIHKAFQGVKGGKIIGNRVLE